MLIITTVFCRDVEEQRKLKIKQKMQELRDMQKVLVVSDAFCVVLLCSAPKTGMGRWLFFLTSSTQFGLCCDCIILMLL